MIDVHNQFLSEEELYTLKKNIFGNEYFPWYYSNYKVIPGDNIVQFTHIFYEDTLIKSNNFTGLLLPILYNEYNVFLFLLSFNK